ncbi:RICIN domain-containing protein [Protaetiibacter intestinalis]|uniref:Ricin B lectin domain-containing protein n=1 Tax=Protaetiibacter intestinalis TaxID=2419774 RepID=A0A387BA67_9MICO|nr:RICIN domain-containing protein [Protaetiibacter intestinalis]AYF98026.1 hypothetical protein D7I47_07005 [Protaetiibacter intestinalis]
MRSTTTADAPTSRRRAAALLLGTLLAVTGVGLTASPAAAATTTLVVSADQTLRPVSYVATGSLYGLADANTPSDALVQAIKPNTFVQMPPGGHQQGTGDILVVASKAQRAGAKLVLRMSDYYAGWPYQFSWDTWLATVRDMVTQIKNSPYYSSVVAYAPWNESDNTWLASNGTFEDFWTRTVQEIKKIDATKPIQGPSFSDNISTMRTFLQNAKNTGTLPDILAWHELIRSGKLITDLQTVNGILSDLGISQRPIDIEEYAAPAEVGLPGPLVGYIAKFERYGITRAELAFWNQSGTLGDLLTSRGGSPNAAYWLYTWYAQMSGNMVVTTPPNASTGIDGAASVSADKKTVSVIVGGGSGDTAVQINGLGSLSLGSTVTVKVERTQSLGRTVASSGATTLSTATYTPVNGSITVPITATTNDAYRVTVTPGSGGGSTGVAGTYRITNVHSGLPLDTAGSGTSAGTLVQQATANGSSTSQVWNVTDAGNGQYKIVNSKSGLVLGIQNASTSQGASALIWGDNGTTDHLWTFVSDGAGHYKIRNANSGLVLGVTNMSTSSGAQVLQWPDNGTEDHLWTLGSATASLAGDYRITNQNSGLRLATQNAGTTAGTLAVQSTASTSTTQVWTLQDAGNGQFRIVNKASGLVLGIQNASTSQGASALVWNNTGTADHFWTFVSDGAGHYKIRNANSGLVLGVTNMSTSSGAQVLQWGDTGTADHLWNLTGA